MATPAPAPSGVSTSDFVFLPMKLDAFVFNEHVCNGDKLEAKIAPITQPNYTVLRLENFYLQNDIVNHIDLHAVSPASKNPRFTDLRTAQPRTNRQGVYVHWIVPRLYRIAGAQKKEADTSDEPQALQPAPNRWLVVRWIELASIEPAGAKVDEVEAWVVESDCKHDIYKDLTEDDDMQVDVSPFVAAEEGEVDIRKQAEVFIGKKTALPKWDEAENPRGVSINLLNSSNQLFADYQPHNSNVFSMLDPFEYDDGTPTKKKLTKGNASYYVIGWHARRDQDPFASGGSASREARLAALSLSLANQTGDGVAQWLSKEAYTRAYNAQLLVVGALIDPFTPVNVYSGILPPKPLQLLPWVWQDALQKMMAFLHLGPLVMINDVPAFNKSKELTDNWEDVTPAPSAVCMHTMQGVDWAWLQPYLVKKPVKPGTGATEGSSGAEAAGDVVQEEVKKVFMPLAVDQVEPELRFETGPYTAIEGYLQMRRWLIQKAK